MDDYMFKFFVDECKEVHEATSYLEVLNYSDTFYNCVEEHPLTSDEFENYLNERGAFRAPDKMKPDTKRQSAMRLVLQKNAKDNETFAPFVISFPRATYKSMVETMRLPYRAIEGTSVVGPFFWCSYDQDDEDPHLQIIFRKSDVRKKGKTRGWEIMLSHAVKSGLTTGFVKGTSSSDIAESITHLKACSAQVGHPMLLPIIILSYDLSPRNDQKQRDARDWLRRLEHAVSMRDAIEEKEGYVREDGVMEVDAISRDLVECHSQVLWKRPQAYQEVVAQMKEAMQKFWAQLPDERKAGVEGAQLDKLHRSLLSRLDFYTAKLVGIENYQATTLERLHIQRSALYNLLSQRESKIQFQMAGEQRRLAHASKRDSTAMKTISLLGAIFLPGTFLASVFSMTFFDFGAGAETVVSTQLWVYFVITVPVTAAIVLGWLQFDRRREGRFKLEDDDLEKNIEHMEADIMAMMRKRTMSKANTWTSVTAPVKP
ncbi:hypothetical protein VD0004_g8491 [Verticillium dahliae]|uniref:Uncharacterized protein n=2 Tax=Verticillium TaxID=1036719 RepID=A0A0G4MKC7_VERLO|nr:hypothetical protein HYQ44_019099 [Verticillium longisporum]PNH38332.1 hypothetical protein VD0004_g8491 [Verticillium dahliae]PNH65497.1 hypothetical protein VD0001_g8480 [Verticillium dahliae]RXG47533.1 hypothetical protein VDGE_06473 [Verticillium dahliae]CRK34758.1 hypothetical protein BN1708_006494 [Verticillium longisporum]